MDARAPNPDERSIMGPEAIGIEIAVAAGVMSMATMRMVPTLCIAVTETKVKSTMRRVVIDLDPNAHGLSEDRVKGSSKGRKSRKSPVRQPHQYQWSSTYPGLVRPRYSQRGCGRGRWNFSDSNQDDS